MSPAELKLVSLADDMWNVRWIFEADMNADGVVSISDVWLWIKWVYFAPGDFALLMLMSKAPSLAMFLEIDIFSIFGWLSGLLSAAFFLLVLTALSMFDGEGASRSRIN